MQVLAVVDFPGTSAEPDYLDRLVAWLNADGEGPYGHGSRSGAWDAGLMAFYRQREGEYVEVAPEVVLCHGGLYFKASWPSE